MATLRRSTRKNLLCFYCNRRTGPRSDRSMKTFECPECGAQNYFDEKGDIADPPISTNDAGFESTRYAYDLSPDSPPNYSHAGSEIWCPTCLRNQHLRMSAIAQYEVEIDENNPNYSVNHDRKWYKFLRDLERLYPQVCDVCQPGALAHWKSNIKIAKMRHLGRQLQRTKEIFAQQTNNYSIWGCCVFFAKLLWHFGLFGQLLWSFIFASIVLLYPSAGTFDDSLPPSATLAWFKSGLELLTSIISLNTLGRWSLVASIFSIWWNPFVKQHNRGFRRHINGTANWYTLQSLLVTSRAFFYLIMTHAETTPERKAAFHLVFSPFVVLLFIKSRYSLNVDTSPLFVDPPDEFACVGPRSISASPELDSMNNNLHKASRTSLVKSNSPSPSPSLPMPTLINYHQTPPSNLHTALPSSFRQRLREYCTTPNRNLQQRPMKSKFVSSSDVSDQNGPSGLYNALVQSESQQKNIATKPRPLSDMSEAERSFYNRTGQLPLSWRSEYAEPESEVADEMDWTAESSEHRAFQPLSPAEGNVKLFGQTPIDDKKGPSWYRAPPAPITPAHRLRNPLAQPAFFPTPKSVQDNFFKEMTGRSMQSGQTSGDQVTRNVRHEMVLAQQRFFAPPPASTAAGDELADFLKEYALNDIEASNKFILAACAAAAVGLFVWRVWFWEYV